MLVAGLSLLGLFAWIFSGGGGKQPVNPAAKSSQASGILPAAAYSGAPTVTGSGSGSAAASPSASGSAGSASGKPAASKPAAGKSARAHATSSAPAVASAREPGGGCYPSAVVLSLVSSKSEYYTGQDPEFDLYAVSTGSGTCSFNISPAKLHVVVMSAGRIIWDSADCIHGTANQVAWLSRGVPAQESVTWNRSISLPGCVTLASAARAGTYQVQARSAAVDSPVQTFKLARLPSADVLQVGPQDGGERLADVLHLHHLHERRRAVSGLQGAAGGRWDDGTPETHPLGLGQPSRQRRDAADLAGQADFADRDHAARHAQVRGRTGEGDRDGQVH
jgi:hypothetical protein